MVISSSGMAYAANYYCSTGTSNIKRHSESRLCRKRRYNHENPESRKYLWNSRYSITSVCCWILLSPWCFKKENTAKVLAIESSTQLSFRKRKMTPHGALAIFQATEGITKQQPSQVFHEKSVCVRRMQQQQRLVRIQRVPSGGEQKKSDYDVDGQNFDEALDSYIDDLIAEVDDEYGDDNETDDQSNMKYSNPELKNDSNPSKVMSRKSKPGEAKQRNVTKGQRSSIADTDASKVETQKSEGSKQRKKKGKKSVVKNEKRKDHATKKSVETSKETKSVEFVEDEIQNHPESKPEKQLHQYQQDRRNTLPNSPPTPPPNAIYRFLLRRGRIGHIIVMTLVLIQEFINIYLPPLARILAYLWKRYGPKEPPTTRRGDLPNRSRRKLSRAEKKAASLHSDKYALIQLKQLGNIHQAKYRHVSNSFLQRHGLGPFAANTRSASKKKKNILVLAEKKSTKTVMAEAPKSDSFLDKIISPFANKQQQADQEKNPRRDDDDDDDVNWLIHALTKKTMKRPKTIEQGLSTNEIREEIIQVVTSERQKKKKSLNRVSSGGVNRRDVDNTDVDGGGFVARTIRAAASSGTNSLLLSRTLLGAYPGDAVPPGEAASAEGVTTLARKYGWGEWVDDEYYDSSNEYNGDEDDDNNPPLFKFLNRRKVTRKKKKKAPSVAVRKVAANDELTSDFNFGIPFLDDDEEEQDFVSESDRPLASDTKQMTTRNSRKRSSSSSGTGGRGNKKTVFGIGFEFGGGGSSFETGINFKSSSSSANRHQHRITNSFSSRRRIEATSKQDTGSTWSQRQMAVDQLKSRIERNKPTSIMLNNKNQKSPLLRDDVKQTVRMVRPAMEQITELRRKQNIDKRRSDDD